MYKPVAATALPLATSACQPFLYSLTLILRALKPIAGHRRQSPDWWMKVGFFQVIFKESI